LKSEERKLGIADRGMKRRGNWGMRIEELKREGRRERSGLHTVNGKW
jgi:hypothetical protein